MTVDQYNTNLNKFLIDIEKNNRPLAIAAQSSVQQIGNRIFEEGKKTDGSEIGKYSTDPIYKNPKFTPNQNGLIPPTGKTGKDTFKSTGKKHKTKYIEGGTKEYKKLMGQKNDKVYLKDTNALQSDFRKGNTATKINSNLYQIQLDNQSNFEKIDGLNERYGIITDPSTKEVETFERNANLEFQNALEKYELV